MGRSISKRWGLCGGSYKPCVCAKQMQGDWTWILALHVCYIPIVVEENVKSISPSSWGSATGEGRQSRKRICHCPNGNWMLNSVTSSFCPLWILSMAESWQRLRQWWWMRQDQTGLYFPTASIAPTLRSATLQWVGSGYYRFAISVVNPGAVSVEVRVLAINFLEIIPAKSIPRRSLGTGKCLQRLIGLISIADKHPSCRLNWSQHCWVE